jgi:putative addiction module killer protein
MYTIKQLPEFTAWFVGLKDSTVRNAILSRIKRLQFGLFGDVAPVGEGVSELRIHLGAGWRIYFTQRKEKIIILLVGGSKRTQSNDIKRAKLLASSMGQTEINHD